MEPSTDRNDQRAQLSQQHNQVRSDHGLNQINHVKVVGNILAGEIIKTCGTHQSTTIGGGKPQREEEHEFHSQVLDSI